MFNCNLKQIRYDYPHLHRWVRELYYEVDEQSKGAFQSTTRFDIVGFFIEIRGLLHCAPDSLILAFAQFMEGYALSLGMKIIPWGPAVQIMPLEA
jgi:putative glutathione S-transferase